MQAVLSKHMIIPKFVEILEVSPLVCDFFYVLGLQATDKYKKLRLLKVNDFNIAD